MVSFSEPIMRCMHTLTQSFASSKNYVLITYPTIEVIKYNEKKEVSIKLIFDPESQTFEIQAPTTKYFSKISHYDFKATERHWTRNKGYIFSLIGNLKFCGLWDLISNKDFIEVNKHNKDADKKRLQKVLKDIKAD